MNRRPIVRIGLMVLAAVAALLAIVLPVVGSQWATDARRVSAMTAAKSDRADQTRLLRAIAEAGLKMQRNQLVLCGAARVECER